MKEYIPVAVRFTPQSLKAMDEIIEKIDSSRSQLCRIAVDKFIAEFKSNPGVFKSIKGGSK